MRKDLLLNVLHIVTDGLSDSIPILLSFMLVSFAAGETEVGAIVSIANILNTLAGLAAMMISRSLGPFRAMSLVVLVYGCGFVVNAFSQSIYQAGLWFILASAGFGVFHNVAFSYIASNCPRQSMGKAMGDFTAIGDVGRIPLASLAGFVAAFSFAGLAGWRVVCLAYGLGALLFAGYAFVQSRRAEAECAPQEHGAGEASRNFPSFGLLRNRQFALAMGACMLDALGSNQVFVFLPFLLFAKGIDPKIIGAFALAFTLGCFVGKTVLGRMVDMFGTRRIFVISELAMAALLVVLLMGREVYTVVGVSLLLGIVTKGTVPVISAIITEPARRKSEYDHIFAVNSFTRGIVNMAAPLMFGLVASLVGIHWSFGIMAVAVVCAVLPVLMMDKASDMEQAVA